MLWTFFFMFHFGWCVCSRSNSSSRSVCVYAYAEWDLCCEEYCCTNFNVKSRYNKTGFLFLTLFYLFLFLGSTRFFFFFFRLNYSISCCLFSRVFYSRILFLRKIRRKKSLCACVFRFCVLCRTFFDVSLSNRIILSFQFVLVRSSFVVVRMCSCLWVYVFSHILLSYCPGYCISFAGVQIKMCIFFFSDTNVLGKMEIFWLCGLETKKNWFAANLCRISHIYTRWTWRKKSERFNGYLYSEN